MRILYWVLNRVFNRTIAEGIVNYTFSTICCLTHDAFCKPILYSNHRQARALKPKYVCEYEPSRLIGWLWPQCHLAHTPTTITVFKNKAIVTSQSSRISIYKTIYKQKCWWSPNRQKAPFRQAEHKPNVGPTKDDTCVMWKESDNKCTRCILKKSLLRS